MPQLFRGELRSPRVGEDNLAGRRVDDVSVQLVATASSNFPYAMWVSSPPNIDSAEIVRKVLECRDLAPQSQIEPTLDVRRLGLGGNDWLAY